VGYFVRYKPSPLSEPEMKARLETIETALESFKTMAASGLKSVQAFYRNFGEKIGKKG